MMRRRNVIGVGLLTMILLAAAAAEGPGNNNKASLAPKKSGAQGATESSDRGVYVQVAIWDVSPGQAQAFEKATGTLLAGLQSSSEMVNARVLKNLSELNLQYATYVRYESRMTAEDSLAKQVALLSPFCWRSPETHLIRLGKAYSPNGITDSPTGTEFAIGGVGQIAHLGLWVPYPRFRYDYDKVLDEVKTDTKDQHNPGYIGEETGNEVRVPSADQQTPYSPHAPNPEAMSINYGEYKTFQTAEESFLQHGGDRLAWSKMRVFFGSLQVPTRFYIFQVVQSYNQPGNATGENHPVTINSTASAARR